MNGGGPWSAGDEISILIAIVYVVSGLWLDPDNRRADRIVVLLASGLSLGPLLMIVADPLLQLCGVRFDLIELVVSQARAVLWWGSAVAAIYILRALFKPSAVL